MITVKVTSEKNLQSVEEIAVFLEEGYADLMKRSAFQPGSVVSIMNRAGLPPDIGVGDIAVVLFSDPAPAPFTHVRLLHANGSTMTLQMQTSSLGERPSS
jgi:hypothetical protein